MPKKNAAKASAGEGEPPSAARGKRAKAADTAPVDDGATSPSPKAKKRKSEGVSEGASGGATKGSDKVVIPKSELMSTPVPPGKTLFKVISWNVTTLRSLVNKNPQLLTDLFRKHSPDIVFFQETKLNEGDHAEYEEKICQLVPGYKLHWNSCSLEGSKSYSGTLAMVLGSGSDDEPQGSTKGTLHHFFAAKEGKTQKSAVAGKTSGEGPLKVTMGLPTLVPDDGATAVEANQEGRTITVEYPQLYLVGTYVPNSGDKLQRLKFRTDVWDRRLQEHLKALEASGKPVVWCGDLNVCHLDADIWNVGAKHLAKSAGTTKEERESFSNALAEGKFVDCFRRVHGEGATGWFTYWSVRAGNMPWNRGLRLDYFVASESLFQEQDTGPRVVDSQVLSEFVALDHAAISLTLAI